MSSNFSFNFYVVRSGDLISLLLQQIFVEILNILSMKANLIIHSPFVSVIYDENDKISLESILSTSSLYVGIFILFIYFSEGVFNGYGGKDALNDFYFDYNSLSEVFSLSSYFDSINMLLLVFKSISLLRG